MLKPCGKKGETDAILEKPLYAPKRAIKKKVLQSD
jgi:hypothetical protein